jgi:hypothetical protein
MERAHTELFQQGVNPQYFEEDIYAGFWVKEPTPCYTRDYKG